MIGLWLVGVALAQEADCADGRDAWLAELQASGTRRAYGCLAADSTAAPDLIERAAATDDPARLTRALAVWRLHRLDAEVTPAEARAYNPSDRRLLLDGIKAHRGRKSPAPDHAKVLESLDWYQPDDRYTDARLTALDHRNLAMIEAPPPEPVPVAAEAPEGPAPEAQRDRCGCSASPAQGLAPALLALLGLVSWRRRRAGPGASGAPQRAARPPGG